MKSILVPLALSIVAAACLPPCVASPAPVETLVPTAPLSVPHSLVVAGSGSIYGFTGPGDNSGTRGFFRLSLDGQLTSIPIADRFPYVTKPFVGQDGSIYGFADFDGRAPVDGLVRVALDGTLSQIFDFRSLPNIDARSAFQAANGDFYVLSATGGAINGGVVLRINAAGAATAIVDFPANSSPLALVPAPDGNFYGLLGGDPYSSPRILQVYRLSPSGAFTITHTFDPASEGSAAGYCFAVGPDGALYGLSSHGSVKVALFRVTLAGELTAFSTDISQSDLGDFVLAPDGNFYVALSSNYTGGGSFPPGSILRISTNGTFAVVHQFQTGEAAGVHPSSLVLGPDGKIYGESPDGGTDGGGTIFRLSTATGEVVPVHSFGFGLGATSALTEGTDGKLYGSVKYGGLRDLGYLFRVSTSGVVEKIIDFDGNNGASPVGQLLLASDGNFYGTTDGAGGFFGTANNGTIFQLTPAGVLTSLFSFDSSGAQGRSPRTRLTEGADGKIYGIAQFGGAASVGTVFRISKQGAFELLNSFPSTHENTVTPLTLAQDGNFYCATNENRLPAAILRVSPNGELTELTKFDHAYPRSPSATTLVSAPDGSLYGTLTSSQNGDSVYRCTLDGKITTVARFSQNSITDITFGTDGNLYLGRYSESGSGQLARLTRDGISTILASFPPNFGPTLSLTQSSDGRFYVAGAALIYNGSIFRAELLAPTITGVNPASGSGSLDYDLTGTSFANASRVTFGGRPATKFTVVSRTEIIASAPAGTDASAVSVTTPAGVATFPGGSVPPGPVLNISTRGFVQAGSDTAMIGGFILQGSPKKVIIRALGPSLTAYGVDLALKDPVLELHDGTGAILETNDNWQESANRQQIADTGIPPGDPKEAAIVRTLAAGSYTAIVTGAGATSGVGLVEVYDLTKDSGKLANIATRAKVYAFNSILIGGFIIGGDAPGKVLVRAIGPSLARTTPPVAGALADPTLELRDSNGDLIASNDDWQNGPQAQEIADTTIAPSDPKESAIKASLNPGSYTTIVRGVNNATGIGLVEIYKLD